MSGGYVNPEKLATVDLDFSIGGTDTVSKPFYLIDIDVNHNINFQAVPYVGGSWPYYSRRVWMQPVSQGGAFTLYGFFKTEEEMQDTIASLAISEQINPLPTSPASVFVEQDIRIQDKLYKKCYCTGYKLSAGELGGNGIIYGNIRFICAEIEDYP